MSELKLELVTEGLQFPEGPVAMADGSVIVVEIRRGCLTRVRPNGEHEVLAELGGGPNGAAIGPDGALYVCNNGDAWSWMEGEGTFRTALPRSPTPAARSSAWTCAQANSSRSTIPATANR